MWAKLIAILTSNILYPLIKDGLKKLADYIKYKLERRAKNAEIKKRIDKYSQENGDSDDFDKLP